MFHVIMKYKTFTNKIFFSNSELKVLRTEVGGVWLHKHTCVLSKHGPRWGLGGAPTRNTKYNQRERERPSPLHVSRVHAVSGGMLHKKEQRAQNIEHRT